MQLSAEANKLLASIRRLAGLNLPWLSRKDQQEAAERLQAKSQELIDAAIERGRQ